MRSFGKRLFFAFVIVVFLLAIGTFYYNYEEKWSHVDSFYFSTMTLTTIGYGDLAPTTEGAKIFTSFYAIFGIGIMLYILSSVIGVYIFRQEKHISRALSFISRLGKHEKTDQSKDLKAIQKKLNKPFEKKFKKQEKELKRIKKTFKPTIEKQQKEFKRFKKEVTPSIQKVKSHQKELRRLKKRIKKK